MSELSRFFENSTPSNVGKATAVNIARSGNLSGNVGELSDRY